MPKSAHSNWLYYRAYPRGGAHGMELLLAVTVRELLACGGFDRWFFLRYLDDDGLHLRLRFRAADGDADRLALAFTPILHAGLTATSSAAPIGYRPAVRPARADLGMLRGGQRVEDQPLRLLRGAYEPDVENFGEQELEHAEQLFDASSRAVLAIVAEERASRVDRKALVPTMMCAVASALGPFALQREFWNGYARYWFHRIGTSEGAWRRRFAAKAARLEANGVSLFPEVSAAVAAGVQDYAAALKAHGKELALMCATLPQRPRELAYHLIHLHNNRMGLLPLEEAYFATLLGATPTRGAA
jgi:thiopeptide-type bacteriocin biosynthesis protein